MSDGEQGLMAVDPDTSERTDLLGTQPDGSEPDKRFGDIAIDHGGSEPGVFGVSAGNLKRANLTQGTTSVVTDTPGHKMRTLQAVQHDPVTGIAWIAGGKTLSVVELESGSRTTLSR